MDDRLVIEGLGVECRIGVTEAERATPQKIQLDLELAIDAARWFEQFNVSYLHSSLGYRTPAQYEAQWHARPAAPFGTGAQYQEVPACAL